MAQEYTTILTLELRGPVLTKATEMGEHGVDAVMARNDEGKLCLPGTLVTGKLREAWTELAEASATFQPEVQHWLGKPGLSPGGDEFCGDEDAGRRRLLQFSDFVLKSDADGGLGYRIRMDKERRCVDDGAYQVFELRFGPGKTVEFEGTLTLMAADLNEARQVCGWVRKGLEWTTSFGAFRTIGFGRLVKVSGGGQIASSGRGSVTAPRGLANFSVAWKIDRPLCIAKPHVGENLFESEEVIPGSVLKGAFARRWLDELRAAGATAGNVIEAGIDPLRKELAAHFWQVRFSHAFPSKAGTGSRPVVPPLSTVAVRDGLHPYDLALRGGPCLLHGKAPAYEPDWKDARDGILAKYGWPRIERQLRVRTAMRADQRRAKEGKLYAYEMVKPDALDWLGEIDLSGISDASVRLKMETQLRELLALGLRDLGKTKARVSPAPDVAVTPAIGSVACLPENAWAVTLQTPALLGDPAALSESSTAWDLGHMYEAHWTSLCSDLVLKRYFAKQTIAGGYYLRNRFQRGRPAYQPYLLTEAGSVFVFEAGSTGEHALRTWAQTGLPDADWIRLRHGENCPADALWKHCPYVRENGYGEIALNLSTHDEWNPKPEDYSAL